MKFLAMATLGWTAAIAAVVASGEEARRYPIPQSVALERLATTPLPDPLLDMSGHTVSLVRESGGLSWYLGESDHRSVARVTLAPDGAATEVAISFDLAENALGYSPLSKTRLTRSMAESNRVSSCACRYGTACATDGTTRTSAAHRRRSMQPMGQETTLFSSTTSYIRRTSAESPRRPLFCS